MKPIRAFSIVFGVLAAVGVAVASLQAGAARVRDARTRVVFITATDGKGVPVTDLTAADFAVKEGGKDREVTKAEVATTPLQVSLIIDDRADIRYPSDSSTSRAILPQRFLASSTLSASRRGRASGASKPRRS